MGMYGRDYAWILIGKPEMNWWLTPELNRQRQQHNSNNASHSDPFYTFDEFGQPQSNINDFNFTSESSNFYYSQHHQQFYNYNPSQCSSKQLSEAVERTILVDRHNFIVKNMNSISGMVSLVSIETT